MRFICNLYKSGFVFNSPLLLWSKGHGLALGQTQLGSVIKSHPTLCIPVDYRMPGFPVHHQLPEFTQTHVHWVDNAIQPSHHLSPPFPPAFNLSYHQDLFQWVSIFWVGKIPWKRKWLPTPLFLPEKSHGQRSLVGYIHGVAKSQTRLTNFTSWDKAISHLKKA